MLINRSTVEQGYIWIRTFSLEIFSATCDSFPFFKFVHSKDIIIRVEKFTNTYILFIKVLLFKFQITIASCGEQTALPVRRTVARYTDNSAILQLTANENFEITLDRVTMVSSVSSYVLFQSYSLAHSLTHTHTYHISHCTLYR